MTPLLTLSVEQGPDRCRAAASFGLQGGSVGRSPGNDLVLPDPDKQVSRVHVRILFRREGARAVCVGTNPFLHNGAPIDQGEECTLEDGDKLQVGAYILKVNLGRPSSPNNV